MTEGEPRVKGERLEQSVQAGLRLAAAVLAALICVSVPAFPWAGRGFLGQQRAARRAARRAERQAERANRRTGPRNRLPHAPGFFEHLRDLPPEEQERVLENDERFQRLPPFRQEQVREQLRKWNSLSPQEKQLFRQREAILQSFAPAQRQELRAIFPEYRQLPPERRQAINQAFRKLRNLPPRKREHFLSSPQVTNHFSPDEIRILQQLNDVLNGAPSRSPGPQ